jgi:threonine aldolase
MAHTIPNQPNGTLALEDIAGAVRKDDPHYPRTRMVCLENTHNMLGGRVLSMDYVNSVRKLCDEKGLILHCDGARLGALRSSLLRVMALTLSLSLQAMRPPRWVCPLQTSVDHSTRSACA